MFFGVSSICGNYKTYMDIYFKQNNNKPKNKRTKRPVMDDDSFDEYFDEKKQNESIRAHHRWSQRETIKLLKGVIELLKEPDAEYERPTARNFYDKINKKYFNNPELTFQVMKSKMRHLKMSYTKAIEWKDNVGMELYDSDQKHVNSRVRNICPFYNLLDDIFGPASNSDPIGFRLPEEADGNDFEKESLAGSLGRPAAKRSRSDDGDSLVMPKMEAFCDEDETHDDDASNLQDYEEAFVPTTTMTRPIETTRKVITMPKRCIVPKSSLSFEEKKFLLEKKKFHLNHALESQRISLEEKKLQFDKEKFEKTQKLRKYEIDKEFEIKKLEIQSNERIKRLEFTGKICVENDGSTAAGDDDIEAQKV